MKVIHRVSKFFVGVVLVAGVFFGLNGSAAYAEDLPQYRIQMSPARSDIGDLKPGEAYTGTFKVQNTGRQAFNFKVSVSPYTVIDERYTPNYKDNNQYTDIVGWVKFSTESGRIEPNGEQEISYTVKVPADVPAGGQYAVLAAEIVSEQQEGVTGIAVNGQVGMLLYSNVQGNTRKTGSVLENKIPSFRFNPPITATSIVENTGNTHATAQYILQVYPFFGGEEVYTNEEKPEELIILPETRRFNTISWGNSPHLGLFRVKQTVKFLGKSSVTEKVVFLCPIWFLFIIILLIFCIIFWIVTRIRQRRNNA